MEKVTICILEEGAAETSAMVSGNTNVDMIVYSSIHDLQRKLDPILDSLQPS